MNGILLQAAAVTVVLTMIGHSYVGERRLIGPILAIDAPVTQSPLARAVLGFNWHLTSLLGVIVAVVLWRSGSRPDLADPVIIAVIGISLLVSGVVDAAWSRFRHLGWPLLTLAGALALAALL